MSEATSGCPGLRRSPSAPPPDDGSIYPGFRGACHRAARSLSSGRASRGPVGADPLAHPGYELPTLQRLPPLIELDIRPPRIVDEGEPVAGQRVGRVGPVDLDAGGFEPLQVAWRPSLVRLAVGPHDAG